MSFPEQLQIMCITHQQGSVLRMEQRQLLDAFLKQVHEGRVSPIQRI